MVSASRGRVVSVGGKEMIVFPEDKWREDGCPEYPVHLHMLICIYFLLESPPSDLIFPLKALPVHSQTLTITSEVCGGSMHILEVKIA